MALALTTQTVNHELRTKKLYLIATPSGDYVIGGDTVDLTAITPSLGQSDATVGYPGNITNYSVISCPAGYVAKLIKGATLATWLLKVFQVAGFTPAGTNADDGPPETFTGTAVDPGPLVEIPQAAYPADILADVFVIMLEGPKGQL